MSRDSYKKAFVNNGEFSHFVKDCTDWDWLNGTSLRSRQLDNKNKIIAYLGFDCTARGLHVGHLIPLMLARLILLQGGKIIILLGGATTKIGDPTGKDATRPQLTDEEIKENSDAIEKFIRTFLNRDDVISADSPSIGYYSYDTNRSVPIKACYDKERWDDSQLLFVNNLDWLGGKTYIDFLRDCGRYFSVNDMLHLDSVRSRLERSLPMNFVEFNYVLMQSYDFLHLHKEYGCNLQIGGSDQWGNIIHGVDLVRRVEGKHVCGVTTPLLTTVDGRKMGKTEGGAVWLDPEMLSGYDYWQFFRNVEDGNVKEWLGLFTMLYHCSFANDGTAGIGGLMEYYDNDINTLKEILATEATAVCRGRTAAIAACDKAGVNFRPKPVQPADWPDIKPVYDRMRSNLPEARKWYNHENIGMGGGIRLSQVLVDLGFVGSLGDGKKLISGGGVKVNDKVVTDPVYCIKNDAERNDFEHGNLSYITVGKKKHGVVMSNFQAGWVTTDIIESVVAEYGEDKTSSLYGRKVVLGYEQSAEKENHLEHTISVKIPMSVWEDEPRRVDLIKKCILETNSSLYNYGFEYHALRRGSCCITPDDLVITNPGTWVLQVSSDYSKEDSGLFSMSASCHILVI